MAVIHCGGDTRNGTPCRQTVRQKGGRCRHHRGRPLSATRLVKLMYSTAKEVSALGGAWAVFEKAQPHIMDVVNAVQSLIMPEDFWFGGVSTKSKANMQRARAEARTRQTFHRKRYEGYSTRDRRALERAYVTIGAVASSAESANKPLQRTGKAGR